MSPCSKKLSDLKGKRFKKYVLSFSTRVSRTLVLVSRSLTDYSAGKPQSLFAKLGKKNFEQSSADHLQQTNSNSPGEPAGQH